MAWDLRYTSVESGPTGRSGFQFVATTPGTPPDVTRVVTPYMRYRPPPSAPSAPGPEELAAFPVSFAYGREGDHAVLARCRYTGRDYSGRHGNFAGHAVVATPPELAPREELAAWAKANGARITMTSDPFEAVDGSDCVLTDCWVSMGDEDEGRRQNLLQRYQVNSELMRAAKDDAIFMHCLPAHRGEEVTDEVIDGAQSVVFDEAENRLHAQKGILAWCLGSAGG